VSPAPAPPGSRPGFVIAIDGAAGAGKSTLARGLARALGLGYLNTGLMYRALARAALERGVDPSDAGALADVLRSLRFGLSRGGEPPSLEIEGSGPRPDLLAGDVEAVVSEAARHPGVRALMAEEQRRLGASGAVVEGRDIGSVIFPAAPVKIFLTAAPGARARRRADERGAGRVDAGTPVGDALHARDERDARVNPLVPAPDAVVIDSTELTADQVLAQALEVVRAKGLGRP
jgi:CMP/dCMP kinase